MLERKLTIEVPADSKQFQTAVPYTNGMAVVDRDLGTPPASPIDEDAYIVAGSPTGPWLNHALELAIWHDLKWYFIAPWAGLTVWVLDEAALVAWDGSTWNLV